MKRISYAFLTDRETRLAQSLIDAGITGYVDRWIELLDYFSNLTPEEVDRIQREVLRMDASSDLRLNSPILALRLEGGRMLLVVCQDDEIHFGVMPECPDFDWQLPARPTSIRHIKGDVDDERGKWVILEIQHTADPHNPFRVGLDTSHREGEYVEIPEALDAGILPYHA